MDDKRLRALQQLDSREVMNGLYAYATAVARYCSRRLPDDWSPDDIVHEAIVRLVDPGRRDWDEDKYPDFIPVVKRAIGSLIWHVPGLTTYTTRSRPIDSKGQEIPVELLKGDSAADAVSEIEAKELRKRMERLIEKDDDLLNVYYLMLDGYKPQSIVKKTGMPINRVANLVKQLRRRLLPLKSEVQQ